VSDKGLIRAKAATRAVKNVARPVQQLNSAAFPLLKSVGELDWADLRYLLEVGQAGSLRAASKSLNVSVNTVRAHLARLEHSYGAMLIRRDHAGATLTDAGGTLFRTILEISRTRVASGEFGDDCLQTPGRVTIACTEGLGASWLTSRIGKLSEQLSPLTIDLQFDYDLQRDRSIAADVGIAYRAPPAPDLIVSKLATLHFMLFASPGYINTHGMPETIDELRDHVFVEQAAPGYNTSAIDLLLGSDRAMASTAIRTNSSLTQGYAVVNGAGIAILPSYIRAITSTLVPLPVLPQMRVPVFYYFHAKARQSPSVRTVIDWLKESFDPVKYPFFADTFVHPDEFDYAQSETASVVSLFEHVIDQVRSRRDQGLDS
jgi:DNA-binding transcriptional LysR family regulator